MVSFVSEGNLDSIDTLVCVLLSGVLIRRVGVLLNTCWDRDFSQTGLPSVSTEHALLACIFFAGFWGAFR